MIVDARANRVTLYGELNSNQWLTIKAAATLLLKRNPTGIIISCSGLEGLTPEGAVTFIHAQQYIQHNGARIVFCEVPAHLLPVLRSTPGLRSQLNVAKTLEEALASLGEGNDEISEYGGVAGHELEAAAGGPHGSGEIALFAQHECDFILRLRAGSYPECLAISGQRLLQAVLPKQNPPHFHVCVRIVGTQRQRPACRLNCALSFPRSVQQAGQVPEGFPTMRKIGHQPFRLVKRGGPVAQQPDTSETDKFIHGVRLHRAEASLQTHVVRPVTDLRVEFCQHSIEAIAGRRCSGMGLHRHQQQVTKVSLGHGKPQPALFKGRGRGLKAKTGDNPRHPLHNAPGKNIAALEGEMHVIHE